MFTFVVLIMALNFMSKFVILFFIVGGLYHNYFIIFSNLSKIITAFTLTYNGFFRLYKNVIILRL